MNSPSHSSIARRTFLAGAAAAGTLAVLKPSTIFGADANTKLDIGLIGCGGRGGWIADLFAKTGKYRFVACADYFPNKADAFGNQHGIEKSRRYSGLSGYQRLLEGKLDAQNGSKARGATASFTESGRISSSSRKLISIRVSRPWGQNMRLRFAR